MKATSLLSCFVFILLTQNANGQPLNCEWARSAGGPGTTLAHSVTIDPSGNSFVTGTFTSPTLTMGTTTLANAGNTNIFLAKYDGGGNVLWAKSCKGSGKDEAFQVAADHSGNAIVVGYYESSLFAIGSDTLSTSFAGGLQHPVVAKFDPMGNLLWAGHPLQGNSDAMAVAIDPSNNIFVTGLFNGGYIAFGTDTLYDTTNYPFGNLFVAKYSSTGAVLWAICGVGTSADAFTSLATDPWGNVYATGFVTSPVFTLGGYVLHNPDSARCVVTAKISPTGTMLWAELSSPGFSRIGNSVTTDKAGNPYITGAFQGDSIRFGSVTLTNSAYNDTFSNGAMLVVKYDTAGNAVWGKEQSFGVGAYGIIGGAGIVTDTGNNVYITGHYSGNPVLAYGTDTLYDDTANYGGNLYVAEYSSSGNLLWAKSPAGSGSFASGAIAINDSSALFICGAYEYGAMDIGPVSLPAGDSQNAFICKLGPPSTTSASNIITAKPDIGVYPVPADAVLNVGLPGSGYNALNIYDLAGRLVLAQPCDEAGNNKTYTVNVSQIAAGMYVLQAVQNGFKINRSIVIER